MRIHLCIHLICLYNFISNKTFITNITTIYIRHSSHPSSLTILQVRMHYVIFVRHVRFPPIFNRDFVQLVVEFSPSISPIFFAQEKCLNFLPYIKSFISLTSRYSSFILRFRSVLPAITLSVFLCAQAIVIFVPFARGGRYAIRIGLLTEYTGQIAAFLLLLPAFLVLSPSFNKFLYWGTSFLPCSTAFLTSCSVSLTIVMIWLR